MVKGRKNSRNVLVILLLLALPVGLYFVATSLGYDLAIFQPRAAENLSRPNIILILADDLDQKSMAYLPGLKSVLADQGTTFSHFFVPNAQCCPSRASILRGQYSHSTQVMLNGASRGGYETFSRLGHESSTVATWLKDAGYSTVLIGKYLNGYERLAPTRVPAGWSQWHAAAGGMYKYFDYDMNENGKIVHYGARPQDYITDVISNKAVSFIKQSGTDPFFMYVAPVAPHGQSIPAPRHATAFQGVKFPLSPSYDEKDVTDKPDWVQKLPVLNPAASREAATVDEASYASPLSLDAMFRQRLATMLAVEDMVRSIVTALEQAGKLQNTYIVFASDNGWHMGEHRLPPGKATLYEEDVRVPLIVRGPGVPKGRIVEYFVLNSDLAPTFAALANAKTPAFVDGKSITPLLSKNAPTVNSWRRRVLLERPGDTIVGHPPIDAQGVRTRNDKYVEYLNGEREYYDLAKDPYEMNNLASDPKLADRISKLKKQLDALRFCSAEGCRSQEARAELLY